MAEDLFNDADLPVLDQQTAKFTNAHVPQQQEESKVPEVVASVMLSTITQSEAHEAQIQ